MRLRAATAADVDAITELALAALPNDPVWPYRFPLASQFPAEHKKYTGIRIAEYLENVRTGVYQCMVVEAATTTARQIVALSMWDLPVSWRPRGAASPRGATDHPNRPDANPKRMQAFRHALGAARAERFDATTRHGGEHLHLLLLATHPAYRRRGAATTMLEWGKEAARRKLPAVPLTLFSSPIGRAVYPRLGFAEVGTPVVVQVPDEAEHLSFPAMEWRPEPSGP
ncbi:hypothetical protein B0T26DRAFT_765848 [Lasiosphaeria miniovina]|uniref:N-acetyltransferase domain-containing protein n=1 Tax=Lasiosphaeria miniovina TaxID=1954250 RepID=A0AA40E871_9PEZI|nr:uncharacterized protein B0T26DRAFT_765848 [Lasiosphaeria miniovina]KAK0727596.1 hypothetical protein B0T26DRAFT_765848 [Lasiosphaeria miniovina]